MEPPSNPVIKERLQSGVARLHRYTEGEIVYGVRNFNHHSSQEWSSSGKLFQDKDKCKKYYENDNPLCDNKLHDTVFYTGEIEVIGNSSQDTYIVSPEEETDIRLKNIKIIDRKKPGDI